MYVNDLNPFQQYMLRSIGKLHFYAIRNKPVSCYRLQGKDNSIETIANRAEKCIEHLVYRAAKVVNRAAKL